MANFIGNNDFRGYLNYTQSNVGGADAGLARQLLGLNIGNDAGFNRDVAPTLQANAQRLYQQYQQQNGVTPNAAYLQGANILGSGGGANYAAAPPKWDLNSIYNQAGSQAAGQVNPYYTKQLQDFQNNQAQAKALQDQQRQLQLQSLQNTLTNNLQGNETQRGRTSQDVLTNEQQIGQQADQRQQDQGQQFDEARLAQAKQIAQQGLTGTGQGNQQVFKSEQGRNVQEARQGEQDQQAVLHQELTKARTFEDLANSDTLAKYANTQGQKQSQIDWDKFVQGQASDLQQTQQSLESERLSRLASTQKDLAKMQLNNMIGALSNPAQRLAAAQAYGNSF